MPASRLHQAIAVGNVSEVQKMLSSYDPREVEAVDDSGQTPLHLAISKGNAEIVRSLLRCRANIEAPDKSGWRPLHTACYQGLPEICELLLDAGAQPHSLTADANTPLHYLVRHSGMQRQTMERLVSRLATSAGVASPINLQNRGGDTPLHAAVSKNSLPGVHCLLKHRALPNVPNSFRDTPLHMAVRERAYEIGAALLQAGANPDLPGSQGSSRAMAAQAGDQTFLSIMDDPTRLLRSSTPLAGTPGTPPTLTLTGSPGLTASGLTASGGGGGGGGGASESHSDAYRRFLSTPRGQEELARLEAISRDGEFITYAPDPRDPSGNQPPLLSSEPYSKVADYMIMPMHRAAGRTSSSAKTTTMTQLSIHNYMAQLAAVQQQTYRQIQPTTHMPIPSAWMMHAPAQQHASMQPPLPHDQQQQQQQQQQYPPADVAEPYKLPPDRLAGRKPGESSQTSIAAEMARQAEAKAKEMEEAADKARQAQEAAEAARRAVAEAQEARLRFEREAEERRRAAERDAEQRRIAEEAAQRRAAEEAAQRQLAAAKPPAPAARSTAANTGSEFSALTSAISSGLSLLGGFDRTSPASSSTAASSASHSNSNDDDDDSRDISSDDDGNDQNKQTVDDDEAKRSTVVLTPYGASSSSVAASSSTTSFGSQSMHSDDDDNTATTNATDDDDDDWQQAEVDRYTRQLTEVINWLTLELNKRRVKTAQQLSDALREQAKPFLDTYGRREDLRGARELVMKLHEVLKRYDVEVEGAEERLGLEPFLKGRGSYAETMGPNSNRRRIISDSDESDDSDSRSYSDSGSDDADEFGGGYGASYSGI